MRDIDTPPVGRASTLLVRMATDLCAGFGHWYVLPVSVLVQAVN